jgi:hypothetical protein
VNEAKRNEVTAVLSDGWGRISCLFFSLSEQQLRHMPTLLGWNELALSQLTTVDLPMTLANPLKWQPARKEKSDLIAPPTFYI